MAARMNYYDILCASEELLEEDVADLPFHPGRMASTTQFDHTLMKCHWNINGVLSNCNAIHLHSIQDSDRLNICLRGRCTLRQLLRVSRTVASSISVAAFLDTRLKIYDTLSLQDSPFAPQFLDTTRA